MDLMPPTAVTEVASAPSPALPVPVLPVLLDTGPSARGAHRLQTALTCPALYAFQKLMKHEAALGDRGPLVRGSIGHVALAHHYARLGSVQHQQDPEVYYPPDMAIDMVAEKFGAMGKSFQRLIHDAYAAYQAFYSVERHEVVGVECPVDHQVPTPDGPIRFTQRWDLLTRDDAGRMWVTDHKFVGKIEARTVARYALSIQFTGMVWLGHTLFGKDFGGVRLNLVGVAKGAGSFQFQRPALPPAPDAVRRFPATLAHAERVIASVEALSDPWDAPHAYSEMVCMTPYGPCPCVEMCRFGKGHTTMDGRVL